MTLASDLIQKVQIGIKQLPSAVSEQLGEGAEFIRKHPVTSALTVGGGVLAATQVVRVVRKKRKAAAKVKKRKPKARKAKRKPTKKRVSRRKKQKQPYTAGKRKDTSTRRIRFTKNNQPYIILRSGKARFIKKSSVARMRKRKGGKY